MFRPSTSSTPANDDDDNESTIIGSSILYYNDRIDVNAKRLLKYYSTLVVQYGYLFVTVVDLDFRMKKCAPFFCTEDIERKMELFNT